MHYWASPLEGKYVAGQDVALVGAGNSAGQATVYLATQAAKVWLIVRGKDLASSMSRYLVDRIRGLGNVEVVTQAQMSARLEGHDGMLEAVRWRAAAIQVKISAAPSGTCSFSSERNRTATGWQVAVKLDRRGFILTGPEAGPGRQLLETSSKGVFAIGDVRAGRSTCCCGRRRGCTGRGHAAWVSGGAGQECRDGVRPPGVSAMERRCDKHAQQRSVVGQILKKRSCRGHVCLTPASRLHASIS